MAWQAVNRKGKALYDFVPNGEYQVALQVGVLVDIVHESRGWYKGTVLTNPPTKGIFPASFIQLIEDDTASKQPPPPPASKSPSNNVKKTSLVTPGGRKKLPMFPSAESKSRPKPPPPKSNEKKDNTNTTDNNELDIMESEDHTISTSISIEALLQEIREIIKEWSEQMLKTCDTGNANEYHRIKERMSLLLHMRSTLEKATDENAQDKIRQEVVRVIESSRRQQAGFMVPRNEEGQLADTSNTGVMPLLELHRAIEASVSEDTTTAFRKKTNRRRQESVIAQNVVYPGMTTATPLPPGPLHLHLDVKMCIFSAGESTQLYFGLFNTKKRRMICEEFAVHLTDQGLPEKRDLIGNLTVVYKDLLREDFDDGIHLVVYIYRMGALQYDPKKKNNKRKAGERMYRRPYGCAVLDLKTAHLKLNEEVSPAPIMIYMPRVESDFCVLHDQISNDPKNLEEAPQAKGIVVGLKLCKELPTDKNVPFVNRLELPTHMSASEERNDLYLQLIMGRFLQDKKKSAKNVEVVIKVLNSAGNVIPSSILRGAGPSVDPVEQYQSCVYYHFNNPSFNETLRLSIAADIFEQCHVFISFWHVSSNQKKSAPFAFTFLPLTTSSGAVVEDLDHELVTYKPWDHMESKHDLSYLDPIKRAALEARKETFVLRTKLCSTKKTQNPTLHSLFRWRELEHHAVETVLMKFKSFKSDGLRELSKFVRETFDALFGILESPKHSQLSNKCFLAILHAIGMMTNKKIQTYIPIVNSYITSIFNHALSHRILLDHCIGLFEQDDPDENAMKLCRSFEYMVRLIVRSFQVDQSSNQPSSTKDSFKTHMKKLFAGITRLVGVEANKNARFLFLCQTFIVRGFPDILGEVMEVFEAAELGQIAADIITAVPRVEQQRLNRLNLIRVLLQPESLGQDVNARDAVLPVVMDNLIVGLRTIKSGSLSEPYLCVAILNTLLGKNMTDEGVWKFRGVLNDLAKVLVILQEQHLGIGDRVLKPPSETVKQMCKVDMLEDTTTVVWGVLHHMSTEKLQELFQSKSPDEASNLLNTLLVVGHNALQIKMYPDLWIVMTMLQLTVIENILLSSGPVLINKFGPTTEYFDPQLWSWYFRLILELLSFDGLRMEKFGDAKRKFVESRYGDLRVEIIQQTRVMWEALSTKRPALTGFLCPLVFDLAQNSELEAAKTLGSDMYFDMIDTEYQTTGKFDIVERHTIDGLYNIANISQSAGDKFMTNVYGTIVTRVENSDTLKADGLTFLNHIKRMYELMSSLLKFPNTAMYEDERTSVALKLLTYLEETGHTRKEMSSRYVQYLVNLHVGLGNFVEAGMALIYQIKLLEWTKDIMDATSDYPREAEYERKERLYKLAIGHFNQGEAWENAIKLSEDLRDFYREEFKYDSYADAMSEESEFFTKINSQERFFSNYFRVVYHGNGFDEEIRNREFIYRGVRLESVMDFTNRMRAKFPAAEILMSSDAPSDERLEKNDRIISITTLTREKFQSLDEIPESTSTNENMESEKSRYLGVPAPSNVTKYRENSQLKVFSYSKAEQRSSEKKPANEFKDLWVAKTFIESTDAFPTNRRRCQVVKRKKIMLTPIQNAVQSIYAKNGELQAEMIKVRNGAGGSTLSMMLNGMIDAAVNGGTVKYIEAFLGEEFSSKHKDEDSLNWQNALKSSLRAQLLLLKEGLVVFDQACEEGLRGLLNHLHKNYNAMVDNMSSILK